MSSAGCWLAEGEALPSCLTDLQERAPSALWGAGDREAVCGLDHGATVTIVGSRRASAYGLRVAEQLGHDLAAAGVTVVSGMAWGIDSAAHRGALAAGGRTIAVLAGGPDVVYPRSARRLYREIVATGAAVSEYEPGALPARWTFPERNRIMAALGKLVVVVEAADPSGSLITARDAVEKLGREVGAVPGQVGMRTAAGTNRLIIDGAALIRSAEDVLDRLAGVGATSVRRTGAPLDESLRLALDAVDSGAATTDAVALAGIADPHRAAVALTRLELLGYVRSNPAGGYVRTTLEHPVRSA